MVEIPTPTIDQIGFFLFGVLIGLPAPYWYVQERIQGFARFVFKKLPYEPPPGKGPDTALEEAVGVDDEEDEEQDT